MTAFVSLSPVPGHRTFGNGSASCISSCASVHRAPLWGRRVVRTLADGSGHWCSGRIDSDSDDGHRARCGRLCRSLFVVCRLSVLPLWVFILVSGWRVRWSGGCVPVALAQFSQRRYLFVGRRPEIAHGLSWFLGGCRGTVRRESRVGSQESSHQPQPTVPVRPPYPGQPRTYV